jgi:hypothetical protein
LYKFDCDHRAGEISLFVEESSLEGESFDRVIGWDGKRYGLVEGYHIPPISRNTSCKWSTNERNLIRVLNKVVEEILQAKLIAIDSFLGAIQPCKQKRNPKRLGETCLPWVWISWCGESLYVTSYPVPEHEVALSDTTCNHGLMILAEYGQTLGRVMRR